MTANNTIQIEYNTRLAGELYVGHTDSSSTRLTEINYFYSSTVEVIKTTSKVTVIFANGPSIIANLATSGYLDFVLFVDKSALAEDGTPYGLLGNFNDDVKDDMTVSGSLMTLPYQQTDRGVHSFAQSCKLTPISHEEHSFYIHVVQASRFNILIYCPQYAMH